MTELTKKRIEETEIKIEKRKKSIKKLEEKVLLGKDEWAEDDLKIARRKLLNLEKLLEKYKVLGKKEDTEEQDTLPIIEEFLEKWKEKSKIYLLKEIGQLKEYKNNFYKKVKDLEEELRSKGIVYYEDINKEKKKEKLTYEDYRKGLRIFNTEAVNLVNYTGSELNGQIDILLEKEKKIKRRIFMIRIKEEAGEIIEANALKIGMNGELNGIVKGSKNIIEVETIVAGGYNIQCCHYRVLVKVLKK